MLHGVNWNIELEEIRENRNYYICIYFRDKDSSIFFITILHIYSHSNFSSHYMPLENNYSSSVLWHHSVTGIKYSDQKQL